MTVSLRELKPVLKVIDTEVTYTPVQSNNTSQISISDRVSGWKLCAGSEYDCERLRFNTVMMFKVPGPYEQVSILNYL